MSIESVVPSNHLILCRPLLLPPSIPPSIRVFSDESALRIRWPKYWSLSFSISPSNEYSGLISFRMDWLHLLAVQGALKSLLQHHSSKASILRHSAFFIVQLSHPYVANEITLYYTVIIISMRIFETSLIAQLVKNPPAVQETQVWEWQTLEKDPGEPGEGNGNPLQYSCLFLPGKSLGQRSLVGYSPWGHKSRTQVSN